MYLLRSYRKRFILLNVGLVGLILLITFTMVGVQFYFHQYSELKSVMSQVLKPWNTQESARVMTEQDNAKAEPEPAAGDLSTEESQSEPKNKPAEDSRPEPKDKLAEGSKPAPETDRGTNKHGEGKPEQEGPKDSKESMKRERYKNDDITTIFYNRRTKQATVLSETISFDGDVSEIAETILEQPESFGTVYSSRVIYYREKTEVMEKIAVADLAYIESRMTGIVIVLVIAYLLTMGLMILLSIRLSKFAAKPMERAIEMERQFVSDISHDLKTPITVILANNSIVRSAPLSTVAENRQWLDSTDVSAHEMMEMVNQMLTLSSLEATGQSVTRTAVNLSAITEKCLLQMESIAYENQITLTEDIAEEVMILSEEEYTRRIVNSLIENAMKYEPSGGKVTVTVSAGKKRACLAVHNAGSVIAKEDLPHIFDRFYRGDKTRSEIKGHGLGLTIIRRMTELLHAEIKAESSQEDGTVFTVWFDLN